MISRKMFFIIYSINWPNLIVWLSLRLEILGNECIAIFFFAGVDVLSFEANLIFIIKPCPYRTKNSRQKFKYLENKKSFQGKIKSIFHHFQKAFSCQKLSQTWQCAFKGATKLEAKIVFVSATKLYENVTTF